MEGWRTQFVQVGFSHIVLSSISHDNYSNSSCVMLDYESIGWGHDPRYWGNTAFFLGVF